MLLCQIASHWHISPSRKTWLFDRIIQCIIRQRLHIYAGSAFFFKYAALLPISAQNMRGLHDFTIPAFSLPKSHTYLCRKFKMLRLLHTRAAIYPCCHRKVIRCRNYLMWTSSKSCKPRDEAMMKPGNQSHLPTKNHTSFKNLTVVSILVVCTFPLQWEIALCALEALILTEDVCFV